MSERLWLSSLVHAAIAGGAVLALTPLVRRLAVQLDVVARPKADRWHRTVVPMLGGVGIFGGVCVSLLFAGFPTREVWPLLVAAGGMFAVGFVDDLWTLKPGTKLGAQVAVACVTVALAGGPVWTGRPAVDALLTIFWIIGIANALNLLDNMDGLCAGIAAIAGIACWGELAAGSVWPAHYAAALTGACLAFLLFNFNPASIFMGDSGSLFLGASLAVLAASGASDARADVLSSMAVPVLLLLIPIFDTTFVTVARILARRSAASGGRDHTSHRLVAMGFSEREAVIILWLLGGAGGAVAVLAPYSTEVTFIGPLLLIGVILLGVQLARVRVYGGEDFSALRGRRYTPLLVEFTYRRRIFELLLDVILIALCYYAAYAIRFDRDMPQYADLLLESLPIVIGCQIISFTIVGIYRGTWRYISVGDLGAFAKGVALGTVGSVMVLLYLYRFAGYSRGVFLIYAIMLGACVVGARLSERLLADVAGRHRQAGRRAIIYGAGDGAALLLRELRNNALFDFVPVALIDDDPSKHRKLISRVSVIGGFEALRGAIVSMQPEVVIVSTSSISASRRRAIAETCYESGTALLEFRVALRQVDLPAAAEERGSDRGRPLS